MLLFSTIRTLATALPHLVPVFVALLLPHLACHRWVAAAEVLLTYCCCCYPCYWCCPRWAWVRSSEAGMLGSWVLR
jgi:hypothetical protein